MRRIIAGTAAFVITAAILGIVIFSGVVMMLWNNILTPVLHVGTISLWQAAGILLLARILFGGWKHRRHYGRHRHYYTRCHNASYTIHP